MVIKFGALAGAKGGEAKQKQPTIAENGTPSLATARIVYLWSWGPIVGPVDGLRSVKLDGTPLVAEDGTVNYPGVKWQFRNGELNQTRLEGIAESSNEVDVNHQLLSTTPYLRTVSNLVLDALRVRLSWPQLQSQDQSGNVNGVRIDYVIDIATDGGPFVQVLASFVDRKNVTKYERSHRLDLPAGSRWTMRVRRITPEANSSMVQDAMFVEAVAEVVDSDQEFPLTAVGCIEYDAQQFGGDIAKIAVLMRGRIVSVPTNYDPESRTYATSGAGTSGGIWDGTFKEAYTNNPAWICYDIALNPYYGLGHRIDATMVDRWNLYRIGQYCDQMVPDGQGGMHPRLTCNIYLQKQADAYAVLQDLSSIFHGMSTWDGSQITFNADMPGDPVYTYNPAQILGGDIKYSGTRARDRHNLAMVSWDNPAQGFDTDKEPVFDDEVLAQTGSVNEMTVDAYGCTSLGQAQRAGQYALITEQTQTRGATFRVGLDGGIPKTGQIIAMADPMLAGRANGGRISAVAGRVVTVDRDIDLSTGAKLRVNLPSGKTEARVISSLSGRRVTLSANFSEVPEPECGWILEYDDLKTMQFLVRNITRPEWHQYQLECIQHEPSKFAAIDSGAVLDIRPISGIPVGVQVAPGAVFVTQHVVIEQGIAVTFMTISWDAAPGAVSYDVEWKWGAREWVKVPRTGELSVDVRGIYSGQYMARVRAVSALNVSSLPTSSLLTNLQGKTSLPPAVTSLTAESLLFGIGLKWAFPPGAEDTQRTEIWYGPSNELAKATKLSDLAYPQAQYVMQGLLAGVRFFFWARLVDRTGNIGPWYPAGNGVMGQASSDANPVLDLLTDKLTESQFGEHLLGRFDLIDGNGPGSVNERLEDLKAEIGEITDALVYVPTDAYVRDNTVRVGDNLWTAIDPVPAKADGTNGPPNPLYWVNTGQTVRAANGFAAQIAKNTTDITTVDGRTTVTAAQMQAVQAASRQDSGEGALLDALSGWDATANYAQEVRVRTEQDLAQAQRVTILDSRVGTNEAKITLVETTVATDRESSAQQVATLKAAVAANEAATQSEARARADADSSLSSLVTTAQAKANEAAIAVQQTTSALASTNGKLAGIWSVRMELTQNNIPYAAGFGLGLESGAAGTTSQFVVRADTFLVMNTSSQSPQSFFGITGGQTFIQSAFIQDGTITNAKIGSYISSTNYLAGQSGWILNKNGTLEINGMVAGGGRLVITNRSVRVYDVNGVKRVQLGDLSE
ncbi:phage tail protein [Pseudomonas viridiflava]|uniref:phage tail protein n=1 Tax=Pseudomonas viridiflava TaxID=33069 RepID=UPI0005B73797|nr:phage tail protein [Pseudomonas viridiflava]KIQ36435.1 host specificity protein [Pseudomonas viridiflava]